MKILSLIILCLTCLLSCNESNNTKPNSVAKAPEAKQVESTKVEKKDPVPTTITIQEVSRIALIEAEQFITNAKNNGVDHSAANETLTKAKKAYDNKDFKGAQKLAVSVRKQIEELMNNKK